VSPSSRPRFTITSYALLGLLAVRPWTAYELTQQMRRSLHYVWPKSESLLYNEPKKLVEAGLARVTRQRRGDRTRAQYRITAAGVAAWPGTGPKTMKPDVPGCCLMAERLVADYA
jgi:PadR family transcriptional regulator AphA